MLEPIKPGDDLYPYIKVIENGVYKNIKRPDWTRSKQIDANIRAIKYLLQFPKYQYSIGVFRMFSVWRPEANSFGSKEQKEAFSGLWFLFENGLSYCEDRRHLDATVASG